MSKKVAVWLMIVIMSMSVFNFLFWGSQKNGLHCDETYSYGLSNTDFHYKVHDENGNIRWNTPEDIKGYMVVSEEGKFNYKNVIDNQIEDVHPPLFYFIMHTISSFMPGSDSYYIGIIPSIVFSMGTFMLLYFIAMSVFKKRSLALITVITMAFSVMSVNMVLFIRMYAMLSFFATAAIYLHIKFIENDYRFTKKTAIGMFFVVVLGAYTQYYFLVYMAGTAIFTIFSMLKRKEFKKTFIYIGIMAFAGVIYLLIWPTAITHIFLSNRGAEAFNNAYSSSLIVNMFLFLVVFYVGMGLSTFLIMVTSFVITIKSAIKMKKISFEKHKILLMFIFVCIFYFIVIAKIAPYQTDRYIAPVFPILAVLFIYSFNHACRKIYAKFNSDCKYVPIIIVTSIVVGLVTNSYLRLYVCDLKEEIGYDYIYRFSDEYKVFLKENKDKKCIMIYTHEAHFLFNIQDYKNFEEVAFIKEGEIDKLVKSNYLEDESEIILYINHSIDGDKVAQKLIDKLGFEEYEYVIDSSARNWAKVYRIYK